MSDPAAAIAAADAAYDAAVAIASLDRIDPSGNLSRRHMQFATETQSSTDMLPATKNEVCALLWRSASEFVAIRDRHYPGL